MKDQGTDREKEYVLVTEYFIPDTASTGQLMTDLAVGLQQRGLDMTVYTSQPSYHSGNNKKQPYTEQYEGVQIKRIRAPQFRQSSVLRRIIDWSVFTVWVFFRLLLSRTEGERELIFVTNPPVLPICMYIVCKIRGWEYTYIVYDLYPDFSVELGFLPHNGYIHRAWEKLNRRALLRAKNVVALGPVMKDKIVEKCGPELDKSKVTIIHNWEDPAFIRPVPKSENWFSREHGLVEPFTLLYSGNIGDHHDLESVVRAAPRLDEDVRILIIGEGENKEHIVNLADRLEVRGKSIQFLPYQPLDTLPYSLTAGDITIVSVNENVKGLCLSSKLYTAMAAGKPILLIACQSSDEAHLVEKFQMGFTVSPGDIDGIIEAVERWQNNPELMHRQGKNAREAFEVNFTKDKSIDRYYRMLVSDSGLDPTEYATVPRRAQAGDGERER